MSRRRYSLKGWRWDEGRGVYVHPSGEFTARQSGLRWELRRDVAGSPMLVSDGARTLAAACEDAEAIITSERGRCDGMIGGHAVGREVVMSTLKNGQEVEKLCPECFKDVLLDLVTNNEQVTIRLAGEGVYELL